MEMSRSGEGVHPGRRGARRQPVVVFAYGDDLGGGEAHEQRAGRLYVALAGVSKTQHDHTGLDRLHEPERVLGRLHHAHDLEPAARQLPSHDLATHPLAFDEENAQAAVLLGCHGCSDPKRVHVQAETVPTVWCSGDRAATTWAE